MAVIDRIKYNGTPDVFAWKFPSEELGTWTQLIVNESQEAVLYKGGRALDVFASGRYTLDTPNIPILNSIINLPFGGRSPFTAEVWYVNKAHVLDIKWGTSTPIQLRDAKYGVFLPVRAHGQFGVKIEDARKFLVKLVGTLPVFDKANLLQYFRGLYMTKVKDTLSSYLIDKQVSVLEINAYIDKLSNFMRERIMPTLAEYGIQLVSFYVSDISIPEDDTAVKTLKDALAKRAQMDIVGFNYVQERSFDTLEGAATNTHGGGSDLMGAGLGIGMGFGIGGPLGQQAGSIAQVINPAAQAKACPRCKAPMSAEKRFCGECGFDTEEKSKSDAVTCSACGEKYRAGAKFCPECGNPYNGCPSCRADVKKGSAACPVCGAKMPFPCPKCGEPIEKASARFCSNCGYSFVKKCPACGIELPGEPKFCPECGAKFERERSET
ncbi:MAG TPA: SPFH domain-containing protein [Clostridia bacterium]|nr:SPFH domain-containing protein [Clostridia bacterium]